METIKSTSNNELTVKKSNNIKSIVTISMTNYLEAGSIIAASLGMEAWSTEFNLTSVWIGVLGAITGNAFGAALGAIVGGKLTDIYGRRKMFLTHLIIYAVGVLVTLLAAHASMLFIGFGITGIGVGIGVPASWTYLGEANDNIKRAARIGSSQLAWSIGPCITFLVGAACALIPNQEFILFHVIGNRVVFLHLFIICIIVLIAQRGMKESESWLAIKKAKDTLKKQGTKFESSTKKLFSKKTNIKTLVFLVGVYLFWNLVAGAQGQFMPYIFTNVFNDLSEIQIDLINALIWFIISASTAFLFLLCGDRISYRLLFGVGAVLAVLSWVMLAYVGAQLEIQAGLWLFVVFWGISAGISAQAFYVLWSTELFPTEYRGAAQGFMYFLVRGLIGIYSIILPTLVSGMAFWIVGTIMIAFLVISLIIGILWTPKTRGKTLAEIEQHRYGEDLIVEEIKEMQALAKGAEIIHNKKHGINIPEETKE